MKNESMMKEELKPKLLQAKSAEEVAGLPKNAGMDESKAGQIRNEISSHRKDKELSLDELEAVSGGADLDWVTDGCAATVEAGSWCGTNDSCVWIDVQYDHPPVKDPCPQCGGQMYMDQVEYESKGNAYYYRKCLRCGCVQKSRK